MSSTTDWDNLRPDGTPYRDGARELVKPKGENKMKPAKITADDLSQLCDLVSQLRDQNKELVAALKSTLSTLDFAIQKGVLECHGIREHALAAIAKAENRS